MNKNKIIIIGGAGHVGAPLGIALSNKGYEVTLLDINTKFIKMINNGQMPFIEEKCELLLKKSLKRKKIFATNNFEEIKKNKFVIITIGTNIKKNFNPEIEKFLNFFKFLKKRIQKEQSIIIRSSIFPSTFDKIYKIIKSKCDNLTYCPERIAQGKSIVELPKISQIIAGSSKKEIIKISQIFKKISKKIIIVNPLEAELIKLFSNTYRYINFSIGNQFYTMCEKMNINYERLRLKMMDCYPRNKNLPKSGFTSGPCLLKDTMQLSSFFRHKEKILNEAKNINENLPKFIFDKLNRNYNLKNKTIGILGLSFKPENDDIRDSLSIKLLNLFKKNKFTVLSSDEHYKDESTIKRDLLLKKADIIIIVTPHKVYKKIRLKNKNKIIIDLWNVLNDK